MQVVEAHGARIPQIGLGTMTLKGDSACRRSRPRCRWVTAISIPHGFTVTKRRSARGCASPASSARTFSSAPSRETHLEPDKFRQSLDESLANLQLPSVDLLLIHWNNKDIPFKTSIGALCKAKKDGFAKHVGVANFTAKMLDEAWAVTTEPLVCNQIEVHPFINQDKVLAASKKHGMAVVAYVPIARGKVPGAEVSRSIGKAHGKSAAQVSLRYLVQLGCVPIPRTANPAHMKENMDVFDFTLSDAEMAELKKLNATNMRVVNPPHAPVWDTP